MGIGLEEEVGGRAKKEALTGREGTRIDFFVPPSDVMAERWGQDYEG